jgi:beta-glucosidase
MRSLSSSLSRSALLGAVGLVFVSACQHQIHYANVTGTGGSGSGTGGTGDSTGSGGAGAEGEIVLPVDGGSGDAGPVVKAACQDNTSFQLPHSPGYSTNDHNKFANVAQNAIPQMSLSDKADQMRGVFSGTSSPQYNDIERTYDTSTVKGWLFRDGPRGVNYDQPIADGDRGTVGTVEGQFLPSTVFPTPVARGASFDVDLEYRIGEAMGDETLAGGQTMLLVPCVNILRHPFWGRAQETYGEDDYLLGRIGTGMVAGVQQYVAACVKHFAGNNIEDNRAGINSNMDLQTMREVYGHHFDMIVNDGGAACVMAAYNSVNGLKSTNNPDLLTTMLRNEFGYQGLVLSDWWAMPGGQNQALDTTSRLGYAGGALAAGLDIEVPWQLNYLVLDMSPTITDDDLNPHVLRILEQKYRFNVANVTGKPTDGSLGLKIPTSTFNINTGISNNADHIALSKEAAEKSMVLLKNCPASNPTCTAPSATSILPLKRDGSIKSIAVVGATLSYCQNSSGGPGVTNCFEDPNMGTINFASGIRVGDLGSSRVDFDPTKSVSPFAGIQMAATGITVTTATTNVADITAATTAAQNADLTVVVVGLTPYDEGEEYNSSGDRNNLNIDGKDLGNGYGTVQNNLVAAVAATGKPMVVVIEAGSAVNMPWLSSVPAVVMAWYPGMVGGQALGELLFGDQNFSGKLPITWPAAETQLPPFNQGTSTQMDYFVGYRRFDACTTAPIPSGSGGCSSQISGAPLFPFGYGLSYADYQYSNLQVPCTTVTANSVINVTVDVRNTSPVAGDEVAMAFVSFPTGPTGTPRRSVKEMKGFYRVSLAGAGTVGDAKRITIPIRMHDLRYYDTTTSTWKVQTGTYTIMVGPNSGNLTLTDTFQVN